MSAVSILGGISRGVKRTVLGFLGALAVMGPVAAVQKTEDVKCSEMMTVGDQALCEKTDSALTVGKYALMGIFGIAVGLGLGAAAAAADRKKEEENKLEAAKPAKLIARNRRI